MAGATQYIREAAWSRRDLCFINSAEVHLMSRTTAIRHA